MTASHPNVAALHELSADDFYRGGVLTTEWQPIARYAWDAGIAISGYLDGLRHARLLGTACHNCRRVVIPPRVFCSECWRPMDNWVELSDTGTVNTFSLCYVTWDVQRLEFPQVPAVIDIDGASPGHGILHVLGEIEQPQSVRVGMRVQAVWQRAEERSGSITDIMYWRPLA